MPRSFHRPKEALGDQRSQLQNLAVSSREPGKQLVQVREGFVSVDHEGTLRRSKVDSRYTLRTSVSPSGRARDGYLFGYDSVEAGQRFFGWIDADDEAALGRLRDLMHGGRFYLGRSRQAEYAAVDVRLIDAPKPWEAGGAGDALRVLCVSDLALVEAATGEPRLLPRPSDFGLEDSSWSLDDPHSFLRFRRWSPWNNKRQRPDLERQCIEAGSVMTFRPLGAAVDEATLESVRDRCSAGIGAWRSEGLGEVLVQPKLLAQPSLLVPEAPQVKLRAGLVPDDGLGRWLQGQQQERVRRKKLEAALQDAESRMARYRKIGRSQWGELLQKVAHVDDSKLLQILGTITGLRHDGRRREHREEEDRQLKGQRGVSAQRWSEVRGGVAANQELINLVEDRPREDQRFFVRALAHRRMHAEGRKA